MANDSSDARKRLAVLLDRLDGIRACGTIEQTVEWGNAAAQFLVDRGRALLDESATKPVDTEFQRNFRDPTDPLAEESERDDRVCHDDDGCPTEGAMLKRDWWRMRDGLLQLRAGLADAKNTNLVDYIDTLLPEGQ